MSMEPIQGPLKKNGNDRFEIQDPKFGECELTSGSVVEIHLGGELWIKGRVEHVWKQGYVFVFGNRCLPLIEGEMARVKS